MPLPTRPQRYCDPASLVFLVLVSSHFVHFFLGDEFRTAGANLSLNVRWSSAFSKQINYQRFRKKETYPSPKSLLLL